jgi:hypothetical protein
MNEPHSREYLRTVEGLVALAEAYGCTELEAFRADIEVTMRVQFLVFERQRKSAYEHRRRMEQKSHHAVDP